MLRSRLATITTGIVIGAVVAGGISYAAIPHSKTKQITACILKSGADKGATRIIDAQRGATCKRTETEIAWSATGVNWRGNWNQTAAYEINDVVYFEGTSWRARRTNTNVTPGTSSADWIYLARAGAEGPEGPEGPAGQDGQDGTNGQDATLQRPGHVSTTVDDPAQGVGRDTSLAIGRDGLPIIAHTDDGVNGLRVTHCDDIACSSAISTTVDSANLKIRGITPSITIGPDGLAIVSHAEIDEDTFDLMLRVTHCDNIACTSATSTSVDAWGWDSSITIGSDGLPIISHVHSAINALRVTHCDNIACTSATGTDVDATGSGYSSIAIGSDGLAIVSHRDMNTGGLRVTHCSNIACTTATGTTVDDTANEIGYYTSIAIGVDGLAVVSHRDFDAGALRVSHCSNVTCTSATNTAVDDPAYGVGDETSISIGADGRPIISHRAATGLRVTHCDDVACTSATSTVVDTGGDFTSIAIGSGGLPVISHRHGDGLRVTHCSNRFCLPYHRAR